MTRRRLLAVLLLALARPTRARASSDRADDQPARIGFLASSDRDLDALREGLAKAGRPEGPRLAIDARLAEGRIERYGPLARELAQSRLALVAASGTLAAQAVKQYLPAAAIVFANVPDPVSSGLVQSLERPGGAVTGVTNSTPDQLVRLLTVLKQVAPAVGRVAVIWNPTSASKAQELDRARAAAPGLGLELLPIGTRRPFDFATLPQTLATSNPAAIAAVSDPVVNYHTHAIIELAAARKIPVVYQELRGVDQGGLIAYGAPPASQLHQAARLVDAILKGTPPAELPVEAPERLELHVNVKTARAFELRVPAAVRRSADRLIRP